MNTTRRHPRTMQEAFGPYTDHRIHEPVQRRPLTIWQLIYIPVLVGVVAAMLMA